MAYLVEGLDLFIRKVAYTTNDATLLVRWSNSAKRIVGWFGPIAAQNVVEKRNVPNLAGN
jgi:hypothetical protein